MTNFRKLLIVAGIIIMSSCATRNDGSSPDPAQSNDTEESGTPSNGLAPENPKSGQDSTSQLSTDTTQQKH